METSTFSPAIVNHDQNNGTLVQVTEKKTRIVASVADMLALNQKTRLMLAVDADVKTCTHRGFGAYLSGMVSSLNKKQAESLMVYLASVAPSAIVEGQKLTLDVSLWLSSASSQVAYAVAQWAVNQVTPSGKPVALLVSRAATINAALVARNFEFPASEAPASEAPASEAPASEAPASEAPASEAPASN